MFSPEIIMREFVEISFVAARISSDFPAPSSCCGCAAAVAGPLVASALMRPRHLSIHAMPE